MPHLFSTLSTRKRRFFLFLVCGVYLLLVTGGYYVKRYYVSDVTPEDVRHLGTLLHQTLAKGRGVEITSNVHSVGVLEHSHTQDHQEIGQYLCGERTDTEDLLCDVEKPKFLTAYKNPCWKDGDGQLKCLPYFQLIGADKCGTTDLFNRLIRHPHVEGNQGYIGKETYWWAWKRYGLDLRTTAKRLNFKDYVNFFNQAAIAIEEKTNSSGYHNVITGDGSPMDLWDFRGWTEIPQNAGLQEPKYTTPYLIHHVNPDTKFIILFRDPIERLYSDYFFLPIKRVRTPESFHEAVSRSFGALTSCLHGNNLRHCLYDKDLHQVFNENVRLHIGFYVVYLTEWFKVYPRKQFLIMRFENYISDIPKYMNKVFRFLRLDAVSLHQTAVLGIFNPLPENVTKRKTKAPPMFNKTRDILRSIYEPFNIQLAKLLSDDEYLWL